MDANNVVTAFLESANKYALSQTDDNIKHLQRNLQILVCLTADKSHHNFFKIRSPIASQCITHIVNVFLDGNTKSCLISRSVSVLQNLSKDVYLNRTLQTTFHLHSAISIFLQNYGINVKDALVLQCFHLLENVTYGVKIDYIESQFENLIGVLLKSLEDESSQLRKTCIHILSNVCRQNTRVQNYICSIPDIKQVIKRLVTMLDNEEHSIILYALSILATLTPHISIGNKLWTEEHLMMTFDLIIKVLFSMDEKCATAALDLFLDLMEVPKYQQCFIQSLKFTRCLKKISKALYADATPHTVLYLKLLLSLIKLSESSEKLFSILCFPDTIDGKSGRILVIHPKLGKWCVESNNVDQTMLKISLQLLQFIINFYLDKNFECIEGSVKSILKDILERMCVPLVGDFYSFEEELQTKLVTFEIMLSLCQKTDFKNFISEHLNIHVLEEMAEILLSKQTIDDCDSRDLGTDLFLVIVEIISLFSNPDSNQFLCRLYNNINVMQLLACALTSNSAQRINRGLLLLSLSNGKCPLNILSERLLVRNSSVQRSGNRNSDVTDSPSFPSENLQPSVKNSNNSDKEKVFDSLIKKMEKGFKIKELKSSEIMEIYEYKIAMLTLREQELQSYVDAKSASLLEADRVITQYKCRQADAEAEALKLRSMLKDYEKLNEISVEKLTQIEQRKKDLETELETAFYEIKVLQANLTEQKELMDVQMARVCDQKRVIEEEKIKLFEQIALKDQEKKLFISQLQQVREELKSKNEAYEDLKESHEDLQKLLEESKKSLEKLKQNSEQKQSSLQKTIDAAQEAISQLEEKNETLRKDMVKKEEDFSNRILDLEDEKEKFTEMIKLKNAKLEDLNEAVKKLNESINVKNIALQELEIHSEKLRSTLKETDNQRVKLENDIKILEVLCKQYESSLEEKDSRINDMTNELELLQKNYEDVMQEKDSEINDLKAELEKHKQITGMIHQLTSGKICPPKSEGK
ncbi:protein CIP2A homolog [Stegodyphus dumicola]|uniref:protein CIP2A homolog n=1 Tax=Stegodyphus dumicola TaxID=202533 RepID=UPI0015AA41C2|nr:protein CIP2A homolog [Stegodyphus dumicola]